MCIKTNACTTILGHHFTCVLERERERRRERDRERERETERERERDGERETERGRETERDGERERERERERGRERERRRERESECVCVCVWVCVFLPAWTISSPGKYTCMCSLRITSTRNSDGALVRKGTVCTRLRPLCMRMSCGEVDMDEPLQKAYIHTEPAVRCRSKQRPGVSMGGAGGVLPDSFSDYSGTV